jgi:hypothetical protein
MTKILTAAAALLFATTVWAAEAEVAPLPVPAPLPDAQVPQVPPDSRPQPAPPVVEIAKTETATAPSEPAPEVGWARGRRAPLYVNMMLFAGGFAEDGDNRLTTRDSKLLEGAGGLFRLGAVLDRHHRLGARLQSFVRPTKKVALAPGSTAATTDGWGAVTFGYAGPEYLYTSDLGIYGGISIGVGAAMSMRHVDNDDSNKRDDMEKASAGVASMASFGYEWRTGKWFALNIEAFGGLYHGVDDDEKGMNGGIFGMGMGVGF